MKTISMILMVALLVMVAGAALGQTFQEEYNSATVKVATKDFDGARAVYLSAFTKANNGEDRSRVRLAIGLSYITEEDFDTAQTELAKVEAEVDADKTYIAEADFNIGYIHLTKKEYAQARAKFDSAKTARTLWGRAQVYKGHSYLAEKNYAQARVEYWKVVNSTDMEKERVSLPDRGFAIKKLKEVAKRDGLWKDTLLACKTYYLLVDSDDAVNWKGAIMDISDCLKAVDMSPVRAVQWQLYQKYGANGEDGINGTTDDITNPLLDADLQ